MNVTVSLSGTLDEVANALQQLQNLPPPSLLVESHAEAVPSTVEEHDEKLPLEARQVEKIYRASSPGSREVLSAVANLGGTCSNADVQQKLGLRNGSEVGGRLSSYGRVRKRLKLTDRQPLYSYDYVTKIFRMEPDVVKTILALA